MFIIDQSYKKKQSEFFSTEDRETTQKDNVNKVIE